VKRDLVEDQKEKRREWCGEIYSKRLFFFFPCPPTVGKGIFIFSGTHSLFWPKGSGEDSVPTISRSLAIDTWSLRVCGREQRPSMASSSSLPMCIIGPRIVYPDRLGWSCPRSNRLGGSLLCRMPPFDTTLLVLMPFLRFPRCSSASRRRESDGPGVCPR
jgi:hypothetical protein